MGCLSYPKGTLHPVLPGGSPKSPLVQLSYPTVCPLLPDPVILPESCSVLLSPSLLLLQFTDGDIEAQDSQGPRSRRHTCRIHFYRPEWFLLAPPTQFLPLRAEVSRVSCWQGEPCGQHGREGLIVRNIGFRRKGAYILGRLWQISGSPCVTWLHCVTFRLPHQDDLPVSVGLHLPPDRLN